MGVPAPLPGVPGARELLVLVIAVRGRRLLLGTLLRPANSPLTRRGMPVGPSLLRGRYIMPSRSTATAERRGLAATSTYALLARLARVLWVGVCGTLAEVCKPGGV